MGAPGRRRILRQSRLMPEFSDVIHERSVYVPRMNPPHRLIPVIFLLLAAPSFASPADAQRIQKKWQLTMDQWTMEIRVAATPEARAKVWSARPDVTPFVKQMWQVIGPSLDEEWMLEPAAWFMRIAPGLLTTHADGSTTPTFAKEIDAICKALQSSHMKSLKLIPMCMALATTGDPRSFALLEKIQSIHPDKKIQGVAALGAAMILKSLGDDPELMGKRRSYLTKAIIESCEVDIGGTTVGKLAEDEIYIVRYLSKGRVAPDLSGTDAAGRPLKLSDHKDKVTVLLFWSSTMQEADRVLQITANLAKKFHGKPFVILGVNRDTLEKLRSLEADNTVTWPNFSDPSNILGAQYRVGIWPLVYVLDGERKIHYAGPPGSFVELTADALLSEIKPANK
jgi:peroxiredoxin